MGLFGFPKKETGAKECYHGNKLKGVILFFFVLYISGAKFEEHCSSVSGDILDSVFKVVL